MIGGGGGGGGSTDSSPEQCYSAITKKIRPQLKKSLSINDDPDWIQVDESDDELEQLGGAVSPRFQRPILSIHHGGDESGSRFVSFRLRTRS